MTSDILKPLRVAMISFYYTPEYSGSAKQATSLIKTLQKKDVNAFVIAARLKMDWPAFETIDGIDIHRVDIKGKHSIFAFWFGVASILWRKRKEFDIVHSHGLNPYHGFPIFFAKLLGKPAIGKLSIAHSDIDFNNQGRIMGRLHKWFLKHGDRYVAISSALKNELRTSGLSADKCEYIPNGVDTSRFRPAANKSDARANGNVRVLFVGVIDWRKGIDVLIPAFAKSINRGASANLLLLGPKNRDDSKSNFYQAMRNLAMKHRLENYVEFQDYTDDVVRHFQSAHIFVLPSRQEGMPNVVIEAMACALPVVGTKISGSEDLIEDQVNGYLVEPGNETELADALYNLISNPADIDKMGNISLQKVRSFYALEIVADAYLKIYKQILKK